MKDRITISFDKTSGEIDLIKEFWRDGKVVHAILLHHEPFYDSEVVIRGEVIIVKKNDELKLHPADACKLL